MKRRKGKHGMGYGELLMERVAYRSLARIKYGDRADAVLKAESRCAELDNAFKYIAYSTPKNDAGAKMAKGYENNDDHYDGIGLEAFALEKDMEEKLRRISKATSSSETRKYAEAVLRGENGTKDSRRAHW